MLDLILTIISTTAIGVVIKISETRIRERLTMLFGNYVMASCFAFTIYVLSGNYQDGGGSGLTEASLILAPIGGVIFALNFFLMMVTTKKRGVAFPVILMRLSAIVPLTASIILFGERPSVLQASGVVGALIAAVLMSLGMRGGEQAISPIRKSPVILASTAVALLISFGTADLIMKMFEQWGGPSEKALFLAILFGLAALFSGITLIGLRKKFSIRDFGWGLILGVPNLFASYFIVSALSSFPAYIVFPAVAAGTVMLITLIAKFIFRERLGILGAAGILLTLLSIYAIAPR